MLSKYEVREKRRMKQEVLSPNKPQFSGVGIDTFSLEKMLLQSCLASMFQLLRLPDTCSKYSPPQSKKAATSNM